jgi:hypothetical protein
MKGLIGRFKPLQGARKGVGGQKGLKTGKLTILSKLLDIYYDFNYNIL